MQSYYLIKRDALGVFTYAYARGMMDVLRPAIYGVLVFILCAADWILMRRRVTRRLIGIQTVCIGNHKVASGVPKATHSTSQPEQIHIAYGSSQDSIVVMWASRDQVKGVVKYGNSSSNLLLSTGSDVSEMAEEDYKSAKYVHRAELTLLTAGSRYFYRVVSLDNEDGEILNTSNMFSFKIPPKVQYQSMKYLVYGDMGASDAIPTYEYLEKLVTTDDYAAILHVGDFAYDMHTDHGGTGDKFMNKIQPFAARIPYMTCPGNHETYGDFRHYRTRFSTPGTPWPIPLDRLWHSFDIGLVHFISYSTEVFFFGHSSHACTQFDWLLNDLIAANQNRDKTPWIIAIGHRPMYCSNSNWKDCTSRFLHGKIRYGLENLFHAQGVDLVIQAHEHSYERLWPMYDGKETSHNYVNPLAPTHIISGAAGNVEGVDSMTAGDVHSWSAFRADQSSRFSFGMLEILNRSHLHFEQVNAESGKTIDSFWLVQNNHGPFVPNVTCDGNGNSKHSSCFCPFPYWYIVVIALVSILSLSVIIVGIAVTIICWKKHRRTYSKLPSFESEMSINADNYQTLDNRTSDTDSQYDPFFDNFERAGSGYKNGDNSATVASIHVE